MLTSVKVAFAGAMLLWAQAASTQTGGFDAEKYLLEHDTDPTPEKALSVYTDGAKFGVWYVEKENDEMSPTSIVAMVTPAERILNKELTGRFVYFGFQFIGPSNPRIHTRSHGHNYWPYCDFNTASISIDGVKARYISDVEDPGFCNKIGLNGAMIRQMRGGGGAKVRLKGQDYVISLEGFAAALDHARQLAR